MRLINLISIFLILLSFQLLSQANKNLKVIWIHDFQNQFGTPDKFSQQGIFELTVELETLCDELCESQKVQLKTQSRIHMEGPLMENSGKPLVRFEDLLKNQFVDYVIYSEYIRTGNEITIFSRVKTPDGIVEAVANHKFIYTIDESENIILPERCMFPVAEKLAMKLYDLYNLKYEKTWYIFTKPMDKISESIPSQYDKIPQMIVLKMMDQKMGQVELVKSETTANARLETAIFQLGNQYQIMTSLREDDRNTIANAKSTFKENDLSSFMAAVDSISQTLASEISSENNP